VSSAASEEPRRVRAADSCPNFSNLKPSPFEGKRNREVGGFGLSKLKTVPVVLAFLIVACRDRDHDLVKPAPATGSGSAITATPPKPLGSLEAMKSTLPAGWTSEYDTAGKVWVFSAKADDGRPVYTHLTRFQAAVAPSPEEYLEMRKRIWDKGTTAEIVEQHPLPDGFALTVNVKPAVDPNHPKHETYVLRRSGDSFLDCQCEWVPTDVIRDQVISVCSSATL
jgi:hypothetical protein